MAGLISLSRLIDSLTSLVGRWVSWLILAAVLVSAGNAFSRKFLELSSNAWLELQWYLFGAAFLLASAHTLRQNEHVRIDIVYGLWPRRTQHRIDLFGHVFFLMPFATLMVFYLSNYVWVSFRSGEVSTNAGGLIIWPGKLMLLIGFALLWLQGISEIVKKIAVMRGILDDPNPHASSHAPLEDAAAPEAHV